MTSDEDKKKQEEKELPHPHPTKFVRYGPGPADYFEPVTDWRNRHERD